MFGLDALGELAGKGNLEKSGVLEEMRKKS